MTGVEENPRGRWGFVMIDAFTKKVIDEIERQASRAAREMIDKGGTRVIINMWLSSQPCSITAPLLPGLTSKVLPTVLFSPTSSGKVRRTMRSGSTPCRLRWALQRRGSKNLVVRKRPCSRYTATHRWIRRLWRRFTAIIEKVETEVWSRQSYESYWWVQNSSPWWWILVWLIRKRRHQRISGLY